MKSTSIVVFSIFVFGLFGGISGADESDVGMGKYFKQVGSYDVIKRLKRVQAATTNDQYIFQAGYIENDGEDPVTRVPYLIVKDLYTRAIVSEVKLDWQIKSMCATKNYLYVLHTIETGKHVDTTGHLRVFEISDISNIELLNHELVFQINDGKLLHENGNMVLVATIFVRMEGSTKIFRIDLDEPTEPTIMSNSFLIVKNIELLMDENGKLIRDADGERVYISNKDVYHQMIGSSSNIKMDDEYLYFVMNDDIWSFDIEGRNEEGVKGNPDEVRPYYTGKITRYFCNPDDKLDRIYDYCWSDAGIDKRGRSKDYFFIVGEDRSEFDFVEEVSGDRIIKRNVIKYGIFVMEVDHSNFYGGNGESAGKRASKMSQLELPFFPSRVFSKDNWVFVKGYERVFDEETGKSLRKGRICILDASNPKEIKLVDIVKLDPMLSASFIGDRLYASDGNGEGRIYDFTMENKGFTREIHKTTRSEKNKMRKRAKKYPPRVYTYRYRGYDHAYRDKVSWLKGKPPKTRVLDWMLGNNMKGVVIYDWDDAPPEIAQQLREMAF